MNTTLAEISVSYSTKVLPKDRIHIHNSQDSERAFREIFDPLTLEYREYSYLLLLNKANGVLGYSRLSEGSLDSTMMDTRQIFQIALRCNASKIMIAHNHPSGSTKPSPQDIEITRGIKKAGDIMNIKLLDHIILTVDTYVSLADEGVL